MSRFTVSEDIFAALPQYCLGVAAARGIDNRAPSARIAALLDQEGQTFAETHDAAGLRELPGLRACREAFQALGMNPNKFLCSIEALSKRVCKGGGLPHINPLVDLGNALSLRYLLPMGAHDIDRLEDGLQVRLSTPEDHFLPMGEETPELLPAGEPVYVSGHTVKTRRWIWRQSDDGKITGETSHVFFPIDAFQDVNRGQALQARDELAALLREVFGCEVVTGFVDREHPEFEF